MRRIASLFSILALVVAFAAACADPVSPELACNGTSQGSNNCAVQASGVSQGSNN
jgi:hypothetical protein